MNKQDYMTLRTELSKKGFFKPKPIIGVTALCVETLLFIGFWYLLLQVEVFSIAYWALMIIMGLSMFRGFALLHECGHKAMFNKKGLNTAAGFYTSMFCLVPYTSWRDLHVLHHRWVGVIDKDPTQVGLLKLKESSSLKLNLFRLIWKLCIPIPSIQLILSVFWANPFKQLRKGDTKNGLIGMLSNGVCLLPHIVAFYLLGGEGYVTYVVPMVVCYFLWFEAINFTHHSGLFPFTSETHEGPIPLYEQDTVSRTSSFSTVVSTALAYNFNFHTEHHYFPTIPWHMLPEVYRFLKAAPENSDYQEVPLLGFSAELRSKDPVDVYVNSIPTIVSNLDNKGFQS